MNLRITMTRIETPEFAPEYAQKVCIDFDDRITPEQAQQMQQYRDAMFAAAHKALEDHLERCALPQKDLFPYRGALTGEYYWDRREYYDLSVSPVEPSVSLTARCLGRRRETIADYAGVDITLLFHPNGTFTTYYTGTHVI